MIFHENNDIRTLAELGFNSLDNPQVQHTMEMEAKYSKDIKESIAASMVLEPADIVKLSSSSLIAKAKRFDHTNIIVQNTDTVSAILSQPKNVEVAALNFASYIYPGGGYLGGATAQEECLCKESFLYNVLNSDEIVEKFYKPNNRECRIGATGQLYSSKVLHTPSILFERGDESRKCNIITCAAPNKTSCMSISYNMRKSIPSTERAVNAAMKERIEAVLTTAYFCGAEVVILGAWGCGAFGNEPDDVAQLFKEVLTAKFAGMFKTVIFAVLASKFNNNYDAFEKTFQFMNKPEPDIKNSCENKTESKTEDSHTRRRTPASEFGSVSEEFLQNVLDTFANLIEDIIANCDVPRSEVRNYVESELGMSRGIADVMISLGYLPV